MKDKYHQVGVTRICRLLGITRQAYYQHCWRKEAVTIEQSLVLYQVKLIRSSHRQMGGRKLFEKLQPFMLEHHIKMGRDALFDLLSANGLLVRKKRKRVHTTHSFHWLRKYPNLIREFIPTSPNQLWVSDITYWKVGPGFLYISFITDAYSRKIVGYHVAETLEAVETLKALEMAVGELKCKHNLIHHSDRGIQYCSAPYVKLLNENNIQISMTENGDPLENAIAERVNGILKEEYLSGTKLKNYKQAKKVLKKSVTLYNVDRPHMSIGYLTPDKVHNNQIKTEKLWENYYKKNCKIVNVLQDEKPTVNVYQD